jgi:hypothetical protein
MMKQGLLRGMKRAALVAILGVTAVGSTFAQARKDVFEPGEELVYTVKYGFIKLGTMIVQTGAQTASGVSARMQFATADVPFLHTKGDIRDVINTQNVYLSTSSVKWTNGDNTTQKNLNYNTSAKTLTYKDESSNEVSQNVEPFNDILSLMYNLRTWSASGKSYYFPIRTKDGVHKVICNFTKKISNEDVSALDDKSVRTRIVEGHADMGKSSPLGMDGDFKAYISDDAAAIPVKINMSLGIGSVTLELTKVKHPNWTAAQEKQ